jgi:formamidopyrimidine-DNA glycosylase
MPELPEVETVARGLRAALSGRRVSAARVLLAHHMRPSPEALVAGLVGSTFVGVRRRAKHLLLDLDDARCLVVHLRMTGQLRCHRPGDPLARHTHLVLTFVDGGELRWRDVRRFGWMELVAHADVDRLPALAALGPDALEIEAPDFVAALRGSRRAMKAFLLAQDVVSGIGNIYADEILFGARVHPRQVAAGLSARRAARVHAVMRDVLTRAIGAQGSSIDGQYVAVDGAPGAFQFQLQVYRRTGQPCVVCGTPIRRAVVAARGTHWCPRCQVRR